jgi:uncharacterized membrane protein
MATNLADGQHAASLQPRQVPVDRPWAWLAAGWRDLMGAPHVGFAVGAGLTAAGWALVALLLWAGLAWAILPAGAGFFLVAPMLAAGLYEASRLREVGQPVTLRAALLGGFARNPGQLALLGMALLILHLFWVRLAGLLFALFFGLGFSPSLEALPMALLRSDQLLPFLVVGTGVGAALAAAAFAISAVSIPMLVDRPEMSALEAIVRSLQAVAANPRPMAFWAGLIVVLTTLALLPFFLGLALVLPLLGHATWHAYRDLLG